MNPKAMTTIERAKRAITTAPSDPRTATLVAEARGLLDHAQPWQDVTAIVEYAR